MIALLRSRLLEVVKAVAPLVGVVCVLQFAFVGASGTVFVRFLAGSALVTLGMLFLFAGIDLGVLPMGRFIGAELPRKGSLTLILVVAFALGFATTMAEPDVVVLAEQVEALSSGALEKWRLIGVIATGVGAFAALALFRVVRGFSMVGLLAAVYSVMIALSFLAPPSFVPLAFDAGSVTTGLLTTPVVLALARGLTAVLGDRSDVSDSFGLMGLASTGTIIAVLLVAILLS